MIDLGQGNKTIIFHLDFLVRKAIDLWTVMMRYGESGDVPLSV